MVERDDERTLQEIVQMDHAYGGGDRHGSAVSDHGTPGKTRFMATTQCTSWGEPVSMRMDVRRSLCKAAVTDRAHQHLAAGTALVSHGLHCFPGVLAAGWRRVAIPTDGGAPEHLISWCVNTALDDVQNALHGTYHALRPKYLQRYLSESCYRFSHHCDLTVLVIRPDVAAARAKSLTYRLATVDASGGESATH